MIDKYVKTECGLNKYSKLKAKRGVLAKARLYWFIFFATIEHAMVDVTSPTTTHKSHGFFINNSSAFFF